MRELNECRTEIFWRSAKRIQARRKMRSRVLGWGVSLCLLIAVCAVVPLIPGETVNDGAVMNGGHFFGDLWVDQGGAVGNGSGDFGTHDGVCGVPMPDNSVCGNIDSFSFSLTWGCCGISSYDSATGKLVKTTDASNPEDYVTTYQLTDAQKQQVYELVKGLDVMAYPNTYDPHAGTLASSPPMTLILSVKTDKLQKTITAENIAYTFESNNSEGQRFLSVCKAIQDILTGTEEWQALPKYEHFYD